MFKKIKGLILPQVQEQEVVTATSNAKGKDMTDADGERVFYEPRGMPMPVIEEVVQSLSSSAPVPTRASYWSIPTGKVRQKSQRRNLKPLGSWYIMRS